MSPAVSLNHAVFDKWLCIQVNDLGTDIPGRPYPAECSNQQNQVPAGASQKGRQHDHGHQLRQKYENVDNTIQRSANNALSSRQRANYASQKQGQSAAGYAHQQRLPGSVDQFRKDVIAQRIGAK